MCRVKTQLRPEEGPKTKGESRIAILGDSGTIGEGVSKTENIYPQILQEALNRSQSLPKVQVFNYGVSAYGVKEMAATLEYRMLEIDPALVVMTSIDHVLVLARLMATHFRTTSSGSDKGCRSFLLAR